ncbi:DTW domain-containing protein [Comamonas sp. Y33R10-2]|uniref:tRNA-uridine aminocarboxypropyltransferase n=1 Tax=Comamonas sp. Y33R10-2 TaxID=2853257 RepID=UPI001C5CA984|nr:tRNA-uridine aminocarboxypropyltransferase [Comamonas sp. Y33R10-2]QXZ09556.1 DTW domain-containing protein [Comamonas sp. Y33R10-2]
MSKTEQRPRCPHCHRAQRTCICALAQSVEHQVEVLILMHPMEVHEAKGTGHLLHLCLPRSRIMVREQFDGAELQQALQGSWDGQVPRQSLLLYPDTAEQDATLGLAQASALPQPWPLPPEQLRLVIIDGTWRKSRKMLYLNPALQSLPRVALREVGDSGYAIRKAHLPGQLSSFEAAVLGLAQLQNWPLDAQAPATLNQVFEQFVDRQILQQNANQAPTKGAC